MTMRFLLLIASIPISFCVGCSQGEPVAPASGTITLDGKPLVGATIVTQPVASDTQAPGLGSFGHTDDQGHFDLEVVKPARKGAIVGKHRVMISPPGTGSRTGQPGQSTEGGHTVWADDPRSNRLNAGTNWPKQFSDGSLSMEVPKNGTDSLRFDLKR